MIGFVFLHFSLVVEGQHAMMAHLRQNCRDVIKIQTAIPSRRGHLYEVREIERRDKADANSGN
jgi:hypothetical protein